MCQLRDPGGRANSLEAGCGRPVLFWPALGPELLAALVRPAGSEEAAVDTPVDRELTGLDGSYCRQARR